MTKATHHFFGFTFLITLSFAPNSAYAGAWTQKEGAAQLITSASVTKATKFFDVRGKKRSQLPYYKQEMAAYGEYGLSDGLTLGGQLRFIRAQQETIAGEISAANLGDSEFFLRKRVWKNDFSVFSIQPGITLPSLDSTRTRPKIGADHPTYNLRASFGHSFQLFGRWHYADLTGGYIYRAGKPDDQLVLDTTVGFTVAEKWQVVPQLFLTKSRRPIKTGSTFTQSGSDNYDLAKGQLSVQYNFSESQGVQLGAFRDLRGRNTGQGNGALVSYIWNFQ